MIIETETINKEILKQIVALLKKNKGSIYKFKWVLG